MFVCVFKCWHRGGAVSIPVESKEMDQGGGYEASIRFTRLRGLNRIRPQIVDRSVDHCDQQYARMGFHISIVGYVLMIPIHCS